MPHDDVFFQTKELIGLTADRRIGQHPRGLLEACRRDKALGAQRRLGDSEQHGFERCRASFLA